jgi:3-oxoacyl-[acyl-carrier protein] reductase
MDLGLDGKVVIVAASSKGLGKACALAFAREGARVALCARDEATLESAAAEVAEAAGSDDRVLAVPLDISAPDAPAELVRATVERFGALHVVVPNAGGPPAGTALQFDDAAYRDALELNLFASLRLAREAVPHMRAAGFGRICFITSIAVKQPIPLLALSNTARAGLTGFAKSLAWELAPDGITVNSALPGLHATDRVLHLGSDASDVPMKRLGDPAEFAAAVVFLCSAPASYITGVALQVDGGVSRGLL